MAEVYLAEHQLLESKTAVKVLPEEFARDKEMVGRFLREARSAAGLRHPNIVRIHDVGQEEGVNYFAMDYVDGKSLTEMIAISGGLEEKEIIRLSQQVLSALGEAHKKGIIHRDIKPDNVMVDSRGDAVVMDFGIAKAALQPSYTMAGSFVGTVHYASPEQARGKTVDARSDLYSWGVVMYEMAVGKAPFSGQDTTSVLYQHVHESPKSAHEQSPRISAQLSGIIDKALAKEPDGRYSSAADFLGALKRVKASSRHTRSGTRIPGAFKKTKPPSKGSQALALGKESQAQMDKGQWAAAQVLAEKALSLNPDLNEAREILERSKKEQLLDDRIDELTAEAEACLADGLYDEAGNVISELAGISRDKKKTLDWLEEVQEWARQAAALEASLQRGQALEAAEEWQAAKELYQKQNEKFPDQEEVKKALARVDNRLAALELWEKGKLALEEEDLEKALSLFKEALQKDPDFGKARKSLDKAKFKAEKKQKLANTLVQAKDALNQEKAALAVSLFNQALELEPDHPEAKELLPAAQEILARQKKAPAGTMVISAMGDEAGEREMPSSPGTVVMPPEPEKPDQIEKPPEEKEGPKPAPQGTVVMSAYKEEVEEEQKTSMPQSGTVVMPLDSDSASGDGGEDQKSSSHKEPPPPPPPPPSSPPFSPQGTMVIPPSAKEPMEQAGEEVLGDEVPAQEEKKPESYAPPGPRSMGEEYKPGGADKPGKSKALIVGGLALVAILSVVAVFLFNGEDKKPPAKPPAPPVKKVEKPERIEPEVKDATAQKAANLAAKGQKSLNGGNLDEAEKAFSRALELNPENKIAQKGLIAVGAERRAIFEAQKRKQAEAKAQAAEEERLRKEAEAKALAAEEERLRKQAEAKAQAAEDERLRKQAEAKAQAAEDERLRKQAEAKAQAAEEERLRKQAEAKAQAAEDERLRKEAEAKAQAAEEERLRKEAEAKAQAAEEERLRKEAEAKAQAAEEERLRKEAEAKAQAAEDERLRKQAEAKAQAAEEERLRKQAAVKYGRLVVGCKPPAKVYLDGKAMGQTPLVLDQVLVGEREIQVKAYGAASAKKVIIKENESVKVRFELRGGAIAVNAAPWADLLLDGVPVGATPVQLKDLPLGPHRLSVRRQGYKEQYKDIVLKKGVTARVKFRLQPE
jgi:tetratricopeptide (TPR) repeat protein